MKQRLLFVITQFYKGGAETALLNLFHVLPPGRFDVDFLVLNSQPPTPERTGLLDQVPAWVRVLDFMEGERARGRWPAFWYNLGHQRRRAAELLAAQPYDWAFQVGEWSSPRFVAEQVAAEHKAVWVHADLSAAKHFKETSFFRWNAAFEKYLFVSDNSMQSSIRVYPQLAKKSVCVHNIVDLALIHRQAQECIGETDAPLFQRSLPILLSCANIRAEKNHLRQAEAMHILKERGVHFLWLNLGMAGEPLTLHAVRTQITRLGLSDSFLLLGPRENPYSYMQRATAVAVFSDYESWSMVITEALALGVPVLATRTSGALQQVRDGENGLLCDFSAESIADTIQRFLADGALRQKLAGGAAAGGAQNPGLQEFLALVTNE